MATVAAAIQEVRRLVASGQRDQLSKLNADINSSVTALALTYGNNAVQEGAKLSIDLEDIHVWSVTNSTTVAAMERGINGSTGAAHTAGALVYINPRFSPFEIFQAINEEIDALSSPSNGLYKVGSLDLTWSAATYGYNLTGLTDIEDVLSVSYEQYTGSEYTALNPASYRLARNLPTGDFASGYAIFFDDIFAPGQGVRVVYKSAFTRVSALTDDLLTVAGIPVTAQDIVSLGAAARLVAGSEVSRTQTQAQPDPRRAEEVPVGARTGAARSLFALRQQRISEEASRLARDYPVLLAR